MRKVNKYKSKLFCGKGATCWIVIDLKCKIYNKKEYIIINRYSKGKIIKDYSYKYSIVQFDNGITIKLNKRFILINLPDVMQKEVIYSITNATSALYNINGSNIPEITGEVLYANIADNDGLKVPLMYRTAEKLYKAESDFLKQGLTIKIYDSYRPYKVTKYLYEKTLKIADKHTDVLNRVINGFQYSQRWFLAEHYSSHNYGVAVDMTLVNMEKNEELQMQTYMHNLSVFSVIEYNNENSNLLAKVMKKNDFLPLRSEWWHFQDNAAKIAMMDFFIK